MRACVRPFPRLQHRMFQQFYWSLYQFSTTLSTLNITHNNLINKHNNLMKEESPTQEKQVQYSVAAAQHIGHFVFFSAAATRACVAGTTTVLGCTGCCKKPQMCSEPRTRCTRCRLFLHVLTQKCGNDVMEASVSRAEAEAAAVAVLLRVRTVVQDVWVFDKH